MYKTRRSTQCVDSVRHNHDVSHKEFLKQVQNGPLICDLLAEAAKQHCLPRHAQESCKDAPMRCRIVEAYQRIIWKSTPAPKQFKSQACKPGWDEDDIEADPQFIRDHS